MKRLDDYDPEGMVQMQLAGWRYVEITRMISRRALLVSILKVKGGGRRWGVGKQEASNLWHSWKIDALEGCTASATEEKLLQSLEANLKSQVAVMEIGALYRTPPCKKSSENRIVRV